LKGDFLVQYESSNVGWLAAGHVGVDFHCSLLSLLLSCGISPAYFRRRMGKKKKKNGKKEKKECLCRGSDKKELKPQKQEKLKPSASSRGAKQYGD
jgi:hypothetical protein